MNTRFNLKLHLANVWLLVALTCLLTSPAAAQNKGDAAAGKVLADKASCASCHGLDGNGRSSLSGMPKSENEQTPRISAQPQAYFIKSVHAYKSKERAHESMQLMVEHLSEVDIRNLAAWYGSQTPRAKPTHD